MAERAGVHVQQLRQWRTEGGQRPPARRLIAWAKREGWPPEIFAEGGPMPSTALLGLPPAGAREIEALQRDPDYQPDGSGLEPQLEDDDVLDLLLFNRTGFTRYLMTRFDSPRALPVQAKLGFLDHLERIARERGLSVPKEHLEHLRGLIRGGGL
jgi:hypothetical protein